MWAILSDIGYTIWQDIYKAVKENISFQQFYKTVKPYYPEYSEYDAQLDYLRMEQALSRWDELKNIPDNEAAGRDYFIEARRPTPKRYMMTLRVHVFNENLNTTEDRYITVGSDYLRTMGEWKQYINEAIQQGEKQGSARVIIMEITPTKAWRGW